MAKDFAPQIQICNLYEKTSQSGNKYFVGRWGGARVLLFRDRNSEQSEGSDPIWNLLLQEMPPRQADRQRKPDSRKSSGERPASNGTHVTADWQAPPENAAPFDDKIPF